MGIHMSDPTQLSLFGFLNTAGKQPAFLVPLFGNDDQVWIQDSHGDGFIYRFFSCGKPPAEAVKFQGFRFHVMIGDPLVYAFQFSDGQVEFGSKLTIQQRLKENTERFEAFPFLKLDVLKFTGETNTLEEAKEKARLTLPKRRLVLFFDNLWDVAEADTNVYRLRLLLAERGTDELPQLSFYCKGGDTRWYDRVSGGGFGGSVAYDMQLGYQWLMQQYNPGDEIYFFGFSRGAYTARSLAGMIARCGLLKPGAPLSFMQLYERYQKGDTVRPLYKLKYLQRHGERQFDIEEKLLLAHSYYQRNFIKMLGVWDTVGSLAMPFGNIPGISRRTMRFHNTNLSKIVEHSYQALALDEERKPYWAILWTNFIPAQRDPSEEEQVDNRMVEQRWFAGAHCNVGGGYRNDLLPQRPLAWIQDKARACGLGFRSTITPTDEDLQMSPTDSYAEFLGGFWKVLTLGKRYVRRVMSDPVTKEAHWKGRTWVPKGSVETVNERIDHSVFRRCQLHPKYRPPNLIEWARRKRLDLEALIESPPSYSELYAPVAHSGIEMATERPLSSLGFDI